jgi:class 3 adenylate cyclase/tetratricopeptide (TPR) repeat protein
MRAEEVLERRIVTVMFADLVGFTTLSEQLDAEDIAAIQDRYFAAVRDTVGRYGGRLEKFIGDAAMAVFGVPRVRDDDAERAVRAGLAVVNAVQVLGAELGLDKDALRVRVGVNSGEAVVATGGVDEGRVTGDTVNTAARFQTAAPAGGVLVGESTALAVAHMAELGDQQQLELKGKAQPAIARLVTGLRSEPSREQAMGALRAPTVGREAELAQLARALDRARAGAVERWLVVAPPGVGKSRLLHELSTHAEARDGVAVWRSRARPDAVSPFDAIADLLRSAIGAERDSAATSETIRTRLAAQGLPSSRAQVVAGICSMLAWPREDDRSGRLPADDRDALFAALLDGLDGLAGDDAQVWLIEDVHWAGGDVLAFLELSATRPRVSGRLVIATARPSLLDDLPEWSTEHAPNGRHILRLAPLEPTSATELVAALVGRALPDELVKRIVERSDGNCLFIEELLRTWVSVGTLVAESGSGWRLAVPADEIPLPQSVQAIYAAQLDDLPFDARRLARRASVAGRRFPVRALEPLGATDAGLVSLQRRELVTGPLAEPLLGDVYSYRHALLRDAGYASLARAERARLHSRLARWLEQAAGARSAEVAEQIAGHYAAALDSAPALAASIDDGLDRDQARTLAADWYDRAGQAVLAISAHDAARQLLRRSLDLTPDTDTLRQARRWERLGDATAYAADMTEGATDFERAAELYAAALASDRTIDAIDGLARATASLADVRYQQLRFADSRDLADETLARLPDAGPGATARLLIARGMGQIGGFGPSPEAGADFTRAMRLAELDGDAGLRLRARESLASYRGETGHDEGSEWSAIADDAMALGNASQAVGAAMNAVAGSIDDEPRNVRRPLEKARDIAVAHGLTEDIGWLTFIEAEEAFVIGDWARALELGAAAMDIGEANDYLRLTVRTIHVVVPIASARADTGVLERAARWYASLEGKFEFPDSPYARIVRPAQDLDLAAHGLCAPYVPDVEPRVASFADDPSGPSWSAALDRVLRAWVEAGELDGADRALDGMATFIAQASAVSNLGRGTFNLMHARVALARGDHAVAVTAGSEALARFRVSNAPWWKAKAIRLLERAGATDSSLVAEVEQIEQRLGVSSPSA